MWFRVGVYGWNKDLGLWFKVGFLGVGFMTGVRVRVGFMIAVAGGMVA